MSKIRKGNGMPSSEGQMLGVYQLLSPLGQGGMATVYKAFHPRLDRYVAIKMIHAGYADDPTFLARFEREAHIVARLEHPHIVPIYDSFDHDGKPCIVMKYVEGTTLKSVLMNGAFNGDDLIRVMSPLASALDYAHGQGVLHRDIKPSNILMDTKGTPYLTDFGLAKLTQTGESTISENMLIGTPFYISPEQAQGGADPDHRSDLYSFGVVLYELLTGRVPYHEGTPYAIVHDHIYKPLPPPRTLNPAITADAEQVLIKTLAKRPEDRYESAADIMRALKTVLSHDSPSMRFTFGDDNDTPLSESTMKWLVPAPTPSGRRALAIPNVVVPVVDTVQPVAKSRERRRWLRYLGAGLLAFLVLSLISRDDDPSLTEPPSTTDIPMLSLQLIAIPDITVDEAERRLRDMPENPLAYLALGRAHMEENQLASAEAAIREGAQYAADPILYYASAGNVAVDLEHTTAALLAYGAALTSAENTAWYPAIRAHAGERLYSLVTRARSLTPLQIRTLSVLSERGREFQEPVITAMIARALLTNGRDTLAAAAIALPLVNASNLAEVQLVIGELEQARANIGDARAAYELALADPTAPGWLKMRTETLLTALES